MARVLVPNTAKSGAVRNTSCVPPYPCPQRNAATSPIEEITHHQSPHRLVPVQDPERGEVRVEPKADSGEHAELSRQPLC